MTRAFWIVIAVFSLPAFSQNITFQTDSHSSNGVVMRSVDLNGDGFPDLVTGVVDQRDLIEIKLNNRAGGFEAPVRYSIPGLFAIAFADINRDGHVDMIIGKGFDESDAAGVYLFLNQGDGKTFVMTDRRIPGSAWNLQVADFDKDGKLDVAFTSVNSQSIFLARGNGDGTFQSPTAITSYDFPYSANELLWGDFDGDGNQDLAASVSACFSDTDCRFILVALYGDGHGGFTRVDKEGPPFPTLAIDVDGDTRTDLIAQPRGSQLTIFKGNANRTFTTKTVSLPQPQSSEAAFADLNGDGFKDLAYTTGSSTGTAPHPLIVVPGFGGGNFGPSTLSYSYSNDPQDGTLKSDDFNHDGKPDLITGTFVRPVFTLKLLRNTTSSAGFCVPPSSAGINLCFPKSGGTVSSPVRIEAKALTAGALERIELWVDGAKRYTSFFDDEMAVNLPLSAGTHKFSVYAVNSQGVKLNKVVTATVAGTCPAPSTDGINVCSPVAGSTVHSPVLVSAAGKISGTLARMELWIDGAKRFTSTTNKLQTTVSLANGTHKFSFYVINTAGNKINKVLSATVN